MEILSSHPHLPQETNILPLRFKEGFGSCWRSRDLELNHSDLTVVKDSEWWMNLDFLDEDETHDLNEMVCALSSFDIVDFSLIGFWHIGLVMPYLAWLLLGFSRAHS